MRSLTIQLTCIYTFQKYQITMTVQNQDFRGTRCSDRISVHMSVSMCVYEHHFRTFIQITSFFYYDFTI